MSRRVNRDAERNNPCLKEQEESYACLNRTGFDQDACERFFDNYNTCKKFWGTISRERRYKGIEPELPGVEERAQIKEQYKKNKEREKEYWEQQATAK